MIYNILLQNDGGEKCGICRKKFSDKQIRLLRRHEKFAQYYVETRSCLGCAAKTFPVDVLVCLNNEEYPKEISSSKIEELRLEFSKDNIAKLRPNFSNKLENGVWHKNWSKAKMHKAIGAEKALAYIGNKKSLTRMLNHLKDKEVRLRQMTAEAFGVIITKDTRNALEEKNGNDRSKYVNMAVRKALDIHRSLENKDTKEELSGKDSLELIKIICSDDNEKSQIAHEVLEAKSKNFNLDNIKILENGSVQSKIIAINYLESVNRENVTSALNKFKDYDNIVIQRQIRRILSDRGFDFSNEEETKLKQFLNNDDASLRMMGLSMIEALTLNEELLGKLVGLNMFDSDKNIRSKAKSMYQKKASKELKNKLKENWKATYRNIQNKEKTIPLLGKLIDGLQNTNVSIKDICKIALKTGNYENAVLSNLNKINENCMDIALEYIGNGDYKIYLFNYFSNRKKEAIPQLIQIINEKPKKLNKWGSWQNSGDYHNAADILARMGVTEALEPILQLLNDVNDNNDLGNINSILDTLGILGDKRAIRSIFPIIKDKDSTSREKVAETLEKLEWKPSNDEEKLDFLIAKRQWEYVTDFGKKAVDRLITMLDDEWETNHVIGSLRDIGDKKAIEPLIENITNHNKENINENVFGEQESKYSSSETSFKIESLGYYKDDRIFTFLNEIINREPKDSQIKSALTALCTLGDERSSNILSESFLETTVENGKLRQNSEIDLNLLDKILKLMRNDTDVKFVKPIYNWLKMENLSQIESHYYGTFRDNSAAILADIGKPALKEINKLLKSDRHNRVIATMALKNMDTKPSDENMIPIYLLQKEKLDQLRYFDEEKGEWVTPEEISYIEECVEIGKIDVLCKVLKEFDLELCETPYDYGSKGGGLYERIAETLARIGDKKATEALETSNFHTHHLWLFRDTKELINILRSEKENYFKYLEMEIAAKALGLMKEVKAINALENIISKQYEGYIHLNMVREAEKALKRINETL